MIVTTNNCRDVPVLSSCNKTLFQFNNDCSSMLSSDGNAKESDTTKDGSSNEVKYKNYHYLMLNASKKSKK